MKLGESEDECYATISICNSPRVLRVEAVLQNMSPLLFFKSPLIWDWICDAMVGPRSWFAGLFSRNSNKRQSVGERATDFSVTPLQEARLQKLKERLNVPFDETRPDHQEALLSLWYASFPETQLTGLVSEQWKDMGWQGPNPSTDFRGCGFIALENLLFFARTYPSAKMLLLLQHTLLSCDAAYKLLNIQMLVSFQKLLFKQEGMRAAWEYPFAVAGVNVSFMLTQMLELNSVLFFLRSTFRILLSAFLKLFIFFSTAKPKTLPAMNFLKVLSEDEEAFDILYSIAFQLMDAQWIAMGASYMQFNEVLEATRIQLERELSLDDIHRIRDIPAYNLLYK
ncbi:hypothetical protein ZIOFF_060740 [Zingiber officinale]|uniref:ELMO domain-containing protein n=1 Tax=Zingiber officinale TaxID=94328 RepID=A0A8J5KLE1_ZINOF|nr:hypothetical protein ZIOFF_060740 [Zingiber officinale]